MTNGGLSHSWAATRGWASGWVRVRCGVISGATVGTTVGATVGASGIIHEVRYVATVTARVTGVIAGATGVNVIGHAIALLRHASIVEFIKYVEDEFIDVAPIVAPAKHYARPQPSA